MPTPSGSAEKWSVVQRGFRPEVCVGCCSHLYDPVEITADIIWIAAGNNGWRPVHQIHRPVCSNGQVERQLQPPSRHVKRAQHYRHDPRGVPLPTVAQSFRKYIVLPSRGSGRPRQRYVYYERDSQVFIEKTTHHTRLESESWGTQTSMPGLSYQRRGFL